MSYAFQYFLLSICSKLEASFGWLMEFLHGYIGNGIILDQEEVSDQNSSVDK